MQSKGDGLRRERRPLAEEELRAIGRDLAKLGEQFAAGGDVLRSAANGVPVFAQLRTALALAGRHVLRLLLHRVIDGPTRVPAWLSWSLPSETRRPYFAEYRGHIRYQCQPRRSLSRMVFVVAAQRLPPDETTRRRPTAEDRPNTHRHRYVFLEALDWLGRRCAPRVLVDLPRGELMIATVDGAEQRSVEVVVDWKGHTPEQSKLLFTNIAETAAAVCRLLAAKVEQAADRAAAQSILAPRQQRSIPPRDPLQIVHAVQDLQIDALQKNGVAGKEVHDRLFGESQLYTDIQALADRRPEYDGKPTSQVPHQLQIFAVGSGHEAIARWCERVAGVARTRASSPLRHERTLLLAREVGAPALVTSHEGNLGDAYAHFAAQIAKSLDGYEKDISWIDRAVRMESGAQQQEGKAVLLHPARQIRQGEAQPDGWQPSAHQTLILKLLGRDGRLRTGVLWERISPKHIDLRAHQNAMRDLVDHDQVLTAGKGQATEYWLP